ncbi:MAG: hypothetical protein QF380_00860 [Candidatus Marinimicrobia bacterium]|jgi:hypothetical protein|nr:hypothetical protein [Candidatus Neomarinimicrobiota bacterium]
MVLKSTYKIIILLFSIPFSQENIWKNAEDFNQNSFEPEEDSSSNYFQRIRIIPNGNNENWQQKIQVENNLIQLGLRIDKSSYLESIQNRKAYLSVKTGQYNIIIGNAHIQTGNYLLYGSDYNSIKSPGNLLSPGKIRWNISHYLGSETSSNPTGLFILNNTKSANYFMGLENSTVSYGIHKTWEIVNAMFVGAFPKGRGLTLSLSYQLKNNSIQCSGETALKSNKVAQYFQLFSNDPNISWLGQFRLLPTDWETISGQPTTGFGKSSNEIGFLISVRKKLDGITIYGWADLYREIQNKNSLPIKSGDDFLSGIQYKKKDSFNFEGKARRKTNAELFNDNGIYNLQMNKKYYYTFTFKKMIVLKWKSVHLMPSAHTGKLIQLQSLKYQFKNWSGVLGVVYFDTDNWNSRLYLIEPGLKGEFRIQPYFLEGISIYSKLNWKLNDINSLSFRYSTQKVLENLEKWSPEFGFQLDIVF